MCDHMVTIVDVRWPRKRQIRVGHKGVATKSIKEVDDLIMAGMADEPVTTSEARNA